MKRRINGKIAVAAVAGALGASGLVAGVATAAAAAPAPGAYTLVNAASSLCLSVPAASTADGVQLVQNGCAGTAGQTWNLTAVSGGFQLKAAHSGKCAGVKDASTSAGKAVQQEGCSGASSQTWQLTASGSDYRVVNANGGKCLNTKDNATSAGALVQQNSCDSVATKQWRLVSAGSVTPTPTVTPTATPTVTPTATPTATPTVTPTGSPGNAAGLEGFATLNLYGRAGTNGGAGGETVTVSTYAQLASAVADDAPRIVRVSGTISGNGTEMLDVGSNKTVIGVGSNATISGFGFDVNGWGPDEVAWGGDLCDPAEKDAFTHTQNVIIRNLTFRDSADDSVNVQCYSHHVWVDHNTFYPSYDGSVDVKRGSDLVTVSYNRFVGTDKSMLLGHSDSNGAQDTGYLRATYHHNWFDRSNTRHPRVRFGYAHLFANYVDVTDYFIGLGKSGKIYADGNYVKAAKTITEDHGDAKLTWTGSNFYDISTITRANSSGSTMSDWLRADGSVAPPPYGYSAGSASSSPPAAGAGVGGADSVPQ
ncbi:RICIN domain-containing protein [Streptosporangium sp. NBC_01639]|uniref:RICIN domain-containing protein n=1 Tax=Streptosporangium sp. NBC_01639 TaxID=2975948 RepID=UPI00386D1C75|nr:RICIN domain-containing protein [Streptosporangium sp. NBC_01639]